MTALLVGGPANGDTTEIPAPRRQREVLLVRKIFGGRMHDLVYEAGEVTKAGQTFDYVNPHNKEDR